MVAIYDSLDAGRGDLEHYVAMVEEFNYGAGSPDDIRSFVDQAFGPAFSYYREQNAAQIPTSYGGVVYMMASLTLLAVVIMIEAVPVATRLRAMQFGLEETGSSELVLSGLRLASGETVT